MEEYVEYALIFLERSFLNHLAYISRNKIVCICNREAIIFVSYVYKINHCHARNSLVSTRC